MDRKRAKELECGNANLTQKEIDEGWHFCLEWDGMLCHPEMPEAEVCGCEVKKFKSLMPR